MSYNTKNYTEQGGEKTVIGGTLEFGPMAPTKVTVKLSSDFSVLALYTLKNIAV